MTASGDRSPAGGETRRGRRRAQAVDLAVARRVRRRRLELGMTLKRMAELTGVSHQQMHKYETGTTRLSAGLLHRIAQALDVEVGHFFAAADPEGGAPTEPAAGRGQRRRLLQLLRHVAEIGDRRHREAICQLAQDLAGLGADAPARPPVEQPGPPSAGQSDLFR